jgi:hypothetical protein
MELIMCISLFIPAFESTVQHRVTSENPLPPSTCAALGVTIVAMAAAPIAILALPSELAVFAGFTIAAGMFAAIGYVALQI